MAEYEETNRDYRRNKEFAKPGRVLRQGRELRRSVDKNRFREPVAFHPLVSHTVHLSRSIPTPLTLRPN